VIYWLFGISSEFPYFFLTSCWPKNFPNFSRKGHPEISTFNISIDRSYWERHIDFLVEFFIPYRFPETRFKGYKRNSSNRKFPEAYDQWDEHSKFVQNVLQKVRLKWESKHPETFLNIRDFESSKKPTFFSLQTPFLENDLGKKFWKKFQIFLSIEPIVWAIISRIPFTETLKIAYLRTFWHVWIVCFSLQTPFLENGMEEKLWR